MFWIVLYVWDGKKIVVWKLLIIKEKWTKFTNLIFESNLEDSVEKVEALKGYLECLCLYLSKTLQTER